jgi:hypothetical protein
MNHLPKLVAAAVVVLVPLAGCSAENAVEVPTSDTPAIDDGFVEPRASMTVNGFTIDATSPIMTSAAGPVGQLYFARGAMTISGGAGVQRMGVCALRLHRDGSNNPVACSTVADCNGIPGNALYCTNIDNAGQKYCFVRQGSQASSCAGTPANGNVPIGNGSYTTPLQGASWASTWISYACVNGCITTDPSVSSSVGQAL